jgi:ABC-type phosphate transport system substrate-binding protein
VKPNFRLNQVALAVGAALAGAGTPALALAPADFSASDTLQVYISGASALQAQFNATAARLCSIASGTSTLDKYTAGSNYEAYFCSVTAGTWTGQGTYTKLIIHKSSDKGSGAGAVPLAGSGLALPFLNFASIVSSGSCATTSSVASISISGDALGVPGYKNRACVSTDSLIVGNVVLPTGGVSDVEPSIFTNVDTSGFASQTAPLAITFGFIVSNGLYRSMQGAQGLDSVTTTLDTTVSTTVTGTTVPINDNEANMPSLTRDQIASLFAGTIKDWSRLKKADGTNLPNLPSDLNVYVARRVPSSGSQKATEIFLFHGTAGGANDGLGFTPANAFPAACAPTATTMMTQAGFPAASGESICGNASVSAAATGSVFGGSGTGNVRNCVRNHDVAGRWAIGLLSLETPYAAGNRFRFIKIDGFSPSLLNVYKNNYKNWVTVSAQQPEYSVATEQADATGFVLGRLGELTNIRAVNNTFFQVWGQGAAFALPENIGGVSTIPSLPITQATLSDTSPVLPLVKTGNDNCKLPLVRPQTSVVHPVK